MSISQRSISQSKSPRSNPPHRTGFVMNASFEEKSVWIQLISLLLGLGLYFVVAGSMLYSGINVLVAFVGPFVAAVLLIVAVNVGGHMAVAIASRPDGRDERDRLISWRAESNSSWILAVGILTAITCMIVSVGEVWVAHLLLLSLFIAEITKDIVKLVYYRRGI